MIGRVSRRKRTRPSPNTFSFAIINDQAPDALTPVRHEHAGIYSSTHTGDPFKLVLLPSSSNPLKTPSFLCSQPFLRRHPRPRPSTINDCTTVHCTGITQRSLAAPSSPIPGVFLHFIAPLKTPCAIECTARRSLKYLEALPLPPCDT